MDKLRQWAATVVAALISAILSAMQTRADQKQLGANEAQSKTGTVLDAKETAQDEVDQMDRGGARGVLARLRQHTTDGSGT